MHKLLVASFILLAPILTMSQTSPAQPDTLRTTAAQSPPAPAQPQAAKMTSDDVLALLEAGEVFFLDVREPKELEELGTFEGYVNIPIGQLEKRLGEIPQNKAIITA